MTLTMLHALRRELRDGVRIGRPLLQSIYEAYRSDSLQRKLDRGLVARGRTGPDGGGAVVISEGTRLDGHLTARVIRADGCVEEYDLGHNTVTDAGVAFLVDDWDNNATDITTLNFHAMGTGGSPPSTPAVTVTALVTEVESRVSGTKSQPAANQIRTVATITATAARTINEWGLFSASTAGTMWSSRWFTAITLANGDAIEFTYTLTVSSFTA